MRLVMLSAVLMFWAGALPAQDRSFAILLKGSYTTTSELFPSPEAADPVQRASSIPLDGLPGFGVEVRYLIGDLHLEVGLSAEYLAGTTPRRVAGVARSAEVKDGFRAVPLELTGYFTLPFSGRSLAVHMGGGVGVYFGRRTLRIAGVEAAPVEETPGFGIHVVAGVSWSPVPWVSVFGDLKFRDLQFTTVNAFLQSTASAGGQLINLPRDPLPARVSTTGMVVQAGIMLPF